MGPMYLVVLGSLLQVTKLERDAPVTSGLYHKDSQGGRGSVSVQPYEKKTCLLKF